jgi:hypothetical protein
MAVPPPEDVHMRSSDPAVARTVAEPVLLALGVRAGVDVDRLDELAIALGIAIAAAVPGPVRTHLSRAGTRISVTVSPVARDRLQGRRVLLQGLSASVVEDGDAIALSLDA